MPEGKQQMIETLVVSSFVIMVIAGAVMVAFLRHVLHAIIGLGISLFGMAGLFLRLGSPFVAAMQVLIYIGGISVAMVFAMMLSVAMTRKLSWRPRKIGWAIAAVALFLAGTGWIVARTPLQVHEPAPPEAWAVEQIGHGFLTTYNVVFEGLSLILLLAIIGAILIAKREKEPARP